MIMGPTILALILATAEQQKQFTSDRLSTLHAIRIASAYRSSASTATMITLLSDQRIQFKTKNNSTIEWGVKNGRPYIRENSKNRHYLSSKKWCKSIHISKQGRHQLHLRFLLLKNTDHTMSIPFPNTDL